MIAVVRTQLRSSRGLIASLVFMLAAALAVIMIVMAVGAREADAGARYKVVTKTFTNTNPVQWKAFETSYVAHPYPSQRNVSGLRGGKILDINLILKGYKASYPEYMGVLLVSPKGRNALVMSDAGGFYDVAGIKLTLDDEAASKLPDAAAIRAVSYKPADYDTNKPPRDEWAGVDEDFFPAPAPESSGKVALSTFDGTNPNGRWKLYVVEENQDWVWDYAKRGFTSGWALKIKAKVLV